MDSKYVFYCGISFENCLFLQIDNLDITQLVTEKPLIYIQTFKENGNNFSLEQTLEKLRPEHIILYHSDMSAVRQIELFECRKNPEEATSKVYFLIHDKTVEEQAYLTSLKREKLAFEQLIQAKTVRKLHFSNTTLL